MTEGQYFFQNSLYYLETLPVASPEFSRCFMLVFDFPPPPSLQEPAKQGAR